MKSEFISASTLRWLFRTIIAALTLIIIGLGSIKYDLGRISATLEHKVDKADIPQLVIDEINRYGGL